MVQVGEPGSPREVCKPEPGHVVEPERRRAIAMIDAAVEAVQRDAVRHGPQPATDDDDLPVGDQILDAPAHVDVEQQSADEEVGGDRRHDEPEQHHQLRNPLHNDPPEEEEHSTCDDRGRDCHRVHRAQPEPPRWRGLPAHHFVVGHLLTCRSRHVHIHRRPLPASRDRRATSTSITSSSGHSFAPRRSRSAWASRPTARVTAPPPILRY